MLGKHRQVENDVPETPVPTQRKINQFFIKKLSKEEELEQAWHRLTCAAEEREDWLEDEENRRKKARLKRQEANSCAQQKCREQKQEQEIRDGVRDANGRIETVCIVLCNKKQVDHTFRFLNRACFAPQKPQF